MPLFLHLSTPVSSISFLLHLLSITLFVINLFTKSTKHFSPFAFFLCIPLVLYDFYFTISLSLLGAIQVFNWGPHIIAFKLACLAPWYHTSAQPPWLLQSQLPQGRSHQSCPLAPLVYLHPSHSPTHMTYHPKSPLQPPPPRAGPELWPPITACQAARPNGVWCQSTLSCRGWSLERPSASLFHSPCLSLPLSLSGWWHPELLRRNGCTGLREQKISQV